eukprot:gene13319-17844_t
MIVTFSWRHIERSSTKCRDQHFLSLVANSKDTNVAVNTLKFKGSSSEDEKYVETITNKNLPGDIENFYNPLKVMIFVDATWLYYSLVVGRGDCPIVSKVGPNWKRSHRINWSGIPKLVKDNLNKQLQHTYGSKSRGVEVVRTSVFTSMREDTEARGGRESMMNEFYRNNFDVHRFVTPNLEEKCVDISLAVEMLYLSFIPGAYDIAVIITGDKDFVPALEKTRLMGKRIAICSMSVGCNAYLKAPDSNIRDFDIIWLDNHLEDLIVPKKFKIGTDDEMSVSEEAHRIIEELFQKLGTEFISSRHVGRALKHHFLSNGRNVLNELKVYYGSIHEFLNSCSDRYEIKLSKEDLEYNIKLIKQITSDDSTVSDEVSSLASLKSINKSLESEDNIEQEMVSNTHNNQVEVKEVLHNKQKSVDRKHLFEEYDKNKTVKMLKMELKKLGLSTTTATKNVLIDRLLDATLNKV